MITHYEESTSTSRVFCGLPRIPAECEEKYDHYKCSTNTDPFIPK